MVAAAEMQLANFLTLKGEVAARMKQIMEHIESLETLIWVNVRDKDN